MRQKLLNNQKEDAQRKWKKSHNMSYANTKEL